MYAYEFLTTVAEDGTLLIPKDYARQLSKGESVRVIVLVGERSTGDPILNSSPDNGDRNIDKANSFTALIAHIQRVPSQSANIHPASGLLGQHLANPVIEPDPAFDWKAWEQSWDRYEAEAKAASLLTLANKKGLGYCYGRCCNGLRYDTIRQTLRSQQ